MSAIETIDTGTAKRHTTSYVGSCFCGAVEAGGRRVAGGHGLLPLRIVPELVGRAGERLHPVEAGGR